MPAWTWWVVLVALLAAIPLLRVAIAAVAGPWIGARALARQPDEIHLAPDEGGGWSSNPYWAQAIGRLVELGYDDVGAFTVRELKGVVVHLLANGRDGLHAALYEHPIAGRWITLTGVHPDGTATLVSNGRPSGLAARPGHVAVYETGADVDALHERALAARPEKPRMPAFAAQAVAVFQRGWAEEIAWRKATGISRREVVKVASRQVA